MHSRGRKLPPVSMDRKKREDLPALHQYPLLFRKVPLSPPRHSDSSSKWNSSKSPAVRARHGQSCGESLPKSKISGLQLWDLNMRNLNREN